MTVPCKLRWRHQCIVLVDYKCLMSMLVLLHWGQEEGQTSLMAFFDNVHGYNKTRDNRPYISRIISYKNGLEISFKVIEVCLCKGHIWITWPAPSIVYNRHYTFMHNMIVHLLQSRILECEFPPVRTSDGKAVGQLYIWASLAMSLHFVRNFYYQLLHTLGRQVNRIHAGHSIPIEIVLFAR